MFSWYIDRISPITSSMLCHHHKGPSEDQHSTRDITRCSHNFYLRGDYFSPLYRPAEERVPQIGGLYLLTIPSNCRINGTGWNLAGLIHRSIQFETKLPVIKILPFNLSTTVSNDSVIHLKGPHWMLLDKVEHIRLSTFRYNLECVLAFEAVDNIGLCPTYYYCCCSCDVSFTETEGKEE